MLRRLSIALLCMSAAVGCSSSGRGAPIWPRPPGTQPAPPTTRASTLYASACRNRLAPGRAVPVRFNAVTEASGIVASRMRAGWFWVHNDSGDVARIFGVGPSGEVQAVSVAGAQAVDWEDIAPDHTGAGDGLWLADIGDNLVARPNVVLYRVPEPAAGAGSVRAEPLVLTYPDGPHNAEALLRDPVSGALTIVTKEPGTARIYTFQPPASGGGAGRLLLAGRMRLGAAGDLVTGADVAPDRSTIAVRTYGDVWMYRLRPGQSVADALQGGRCRGRHATEVQGEAVGFSADSRGYVTISEGRLPQIAQFREAQG